MTGVAFGSRPFCFFGLEERKCATSVAGHRQRRIMRIISAISFAFLVACGGGAASTGSTTPSGGGDQGELGTIGLKNMSMFDIHSIQLAPFDQAEWGENLLGDDALLHGETAKLAVFDCKKYDLRMLDDENVECLIQDIDLCFQDKDWDIDDSVLTSCATGWAD